MRGAQRCRNYSNDWLLLIGSGYATCSRPAQRELQLAPPLANSDLMWFAGIRRPSNVTDTLDSLVTAAAFCSASRSKGEHMVI